MHHTEPEYLSEMFIPLHVVVRHRLVCIGMNEREIAFTVISKSQHL